MASPIPFGTIRISRLRETVPMNDFFRHHLRVGNNQPGRRQDLTLEGKKGRMFEIKDSQPTLPRRFKLRPSLQPGRVNTVSSTKDVAAGHAVETENYLPRFACPLKGARELQRLSRI